MKYQNESYSKFDRKILYYIEECIDFVDIGASDGVSESNTYLFAKNGSTGLSVEFDSLKFENLKNSYLNFNVNLCNLRVNPINVEDILKNNKVRKDFSFLSLDIDGYDFFVLDSLLNSFRPRLICAEINEKIPYPIKFTVKYSNNYSWIGDHFYGFSIAQICNICEKHKYKIIELDGHNVFIMPTEIDIPEKNAKESYLSGYVNIKNRKEIYYYNKNVDYWLEISNINELINQINNFYKKYDGQYIIGV